MSDHLTADEAQMAALFVQSICYGAYLVTFIKALTCILGSGGRFKSLSKIHWPTLIVGLLLCVNGSFNLALGFIRSMNSFVYHVKPAKSWINTAKSFNVGVQILLADGMLVYRCWLVYRKSWKIIVLPVILWILGTAACLWILVINTQQLESVRIIQAVHSGLWIVFWALTASLNIYATVTIVYRIWRIDRNAYSDNAEMTSTVANLQHERRSRLQAVIKTIVESGFIYTATSIMALSSQVSKSHSIYITSAVDIIMIGIAFNLIIIRVDNEREKENHSHFRGGGVSNMKFMTHIESSREETKDAHSSSESVSVPKLSTVDLEAGKREQ